MKYGLPPVIDQNSKILIWGSLPGEISLREKEYYANPANQFWKIVFTAFNEDIPNSYFQKCSILLKYGVGLWDAAYCAEREGSLDSNIRNSIGNDFNALLQDYQNIKLIIFNGSKAAKIFRKHYKNILPSTILLPSTSPTPGKNVKTLKEKIELWGETINQNL